MNTDLSKFLAYLASFPVGGDQRIPTLSELSRELGISIASLREQLEVARLLGIVEVKPKSGIRRLPYNFKPAVLASLTYAIESKSIPFQQFSDLRNHLEAVYFVEAAQKLSEADINSLQKLVEKAQRKIREIPSQVPLQEHREFHLLIYKRLDNLFLNGLLDTYWDLYRYSGLEIYPDTNYVERIWNYHNQIVNSIKARNFTQGLKLMIEHMELINQRAKVSPRLSFE